MKQEIHISAGGDVEIPAYLSIKKKGYRVFWESKKDKEFWYAQKDHLKFTAVGPIELLGVIAGYETRGEKWKASQAEVDDFMKRYAE